MHEHFVVQITSGELEEKQIKEDVLFIKSFIFYQVKKKKEIDEVSKSV